MYAPTAPSVRIAVNPYRGMTPISDRKIRAFKIIAAPPSAPPSAPPRTTNKSGTPIQTHWYQVKGLTTLMVRPAQSTFGIGSSDGFKVITESPQSLPRIKNCLRFGPFAAGWPSTRIRAPLKIPGSSSSILRPGNSGRFSGYRIKPSSRVLPLTNTTRPEEYGLKIRDMSRMINRSEVGGLDTNDSPAYGLGEKQSGIRSIVKAPDRGYSRSFPKDFRLGGASCRWT